MVLKDKNQSWQPPDGYDFTGVRAQGAYLEVDFIQKIFKTGTTQVIGYNNVTVCLNDWGREVLRVEDRVMLPLVDGAKQKAARQKIASRRYRFVNGWYIVLTGLEEMIKCLKG